jgi:cobalt-zinc-cadmium efflux system outer membrane protein
VTRATIASFLITLASAARAAVPAPPTLGPELRIDQALSLVDTHGLDLLVAEAAVDSAKGDVESAGAVPNPSLSATYGRSFTYGHCTDATGASTPCGVLPQPLLGASLSDQGALLDGLSGKRSLRTDVARAALAAARASREDARRTLRAQAKQAFLQVVIAQEALRFTREVAAASARSDDLTRARYDAGAISEADLARVDVARMEADQAVDQAEQTLRDSREALAFLLGVRGPAPEFLAVGPELLRGAPPGGLARASPEGLLDRARAHRPDLQAAQRQRERAGAGLTLAERQRFPDVSLSVNYAQQGTTNSAISPPTVSLGLSFPLPLFYRQQGEIAKAHADVATQDAATAKAEAQVASDVGTAWSDYQSAGRLVQRMEGGLLDRARRARELVAIQYQKGAASLLDDLDAQRTYIATTLEHLQDLSLYWGAVFRLEQAVGEDLR